jgi:hypothetical protein
VLGIVSGGNPKKADAAATVFNGQVKRLHAAQAAGQRGEARLAWIAAHAAIADAYGPDSDAMWSSALSSIGFDLALVNSSFIGSLLTRGGANLEAYEDFVIFGDQALDNTRNSSMTVFESGQKQVTTSTVLDKKGKSTAVHTVHDLRVAAVQVSGPYGTIRADILPDHAPQAHQVAAQFNARMASLAPSTITAADLSLLVEAIRASNGQPAAEKLTQLDRLRYDRLLSDEDWKAAKARILSNV